MYLFAPRMKRTGRLCRARRGHPSCVGETTGLATAFAAYEQALASAERADVARARLGLVAALRADGWDTPAAVRDQVWRDQRTVRDAELDSQLVAYPDEALRAASHRPAASVRPVRA